MRLPSSSNFRPLLLSSASHALSDVADYGSAEQQRRRIHRLLLLRIAGLVLGISGSFSMLGWCLWGSLPICSVCLDVHQWELSLRGVGMIVTSGFGLFLWLALPSSRPAPLYVRLRPDAKEFAQPVPLGWQP